MFVSNYLQIIDYFLISINHTTSINNTTIYNNMIINCKLYKKKSCKYFILVHTILSFLNILFLSSFISKEIIVYNKSQTAFKYLIDDKGFIRFILYLSGSKYNFKHNTKTIFDISFI